MPTVHVTPGSGALLQDIANALFKAKKVVVVTGAGISTNSGIPDFRSENGLYSLIQAQFDAASRELEKREEERAEERDARSSPPLTGVVQDRPLKRRKLFQDGVPVDNERAIPPAQGETRDLANLDEGPQTPRGSRPPPEEEDYPRGPRPPPEEEDDPVTQGEDSCITVDDGPCITVDDGMSITVATAVASKRESDVEESIVVLSGAAAMEASSSRSGSAPGSPSVNLRGDDGGAEVINTEDGARVSALTWSTTQLPGRPEDDSISTNQPDLELSSESEPLANSTTPSSSPRASTPRISHLSSDIDQATTYPCSSSPLSSPPPLLSDFYESSSLERTYSRSESPSAASTSSSAGSEETASSGDDSGTSTPYLTSQTSFNSSQSRTTLPNLKGRDLFDASIWADPVKTSVFYTFATTLRQKARDVSPTTSHLFLSVLRDQRKLVRCYTQNIDRLEDRIGLSTSLELGAGSRSRFSAKAWRYSQANGGQGQGPGQKGEPGVQAREEGDRQAGPQAATGHPAADQAAAAATAATAATAGAAMDVEPVCSSGHVGNEYDGSRAREDAGIQVQQGRRVLARHRESASRILDHKIVERPTQSPPATSSTVLPAPSSDSFESQPELRQSKPGQGPGTAAVTAGPPQSSPGQAADEPDPGGGLGGRMERLGQQRGGEKEGIRSEGPQRSAAPALPSSQPPTHSAPNRGVECVFLHGSLESLRCFLCGQTSSWDDEERELETLAGRQPTCPHCAGATAAREERGKRALGVGKLRPDIVLYGEEHPKSDMIGTIVQHDLSLGPDMLLILGTSLRVHGLKTVVREFAKAVHSKGGKVVFVNFTKPPDSVWSDVIDFWVQSDCDAWVDDVKTRKPALWLPPGTAVEEEDTKPAKVKRTSIGVRRTSSGLAVGSDKDSTTTNNAKGKRKSNGAVTKLRRQDSTMSVIEEGRRATAASTNDGRDDSSPSATGISDGPTAKSRSRRPPVPPTCGMVNDTGADKPKVEAKRSRKSLPAGSGPAAEREVKLDPNAKRPQSTREELFNGAYLSWKILEDLKRLTGQPRPSFLYSTAPPPEPKACRARKPRQSAPAVLFPEQGIPSAAAQPAEAAKQQSMEPQALTYPRGPVHPSVRPPPFDPVPQLTPVMFAPPALPSTVPPRRSFSAIPLPSLRPVRPPFFALPPPFYVAPEVPRDREGQSDEAQQSAEKRNGRRRKTIKPRPKKVKVPKQPPIAAEPLPHQQQPVHTSTCSNVSATSICAAIKANPRKRKRKTAFDGVEVVLPGEGSRLAKQRASLPLPARPQTPSHKTSPLLRTPKTPHIVLPPPRPSSTPVTPCFEAAARLSHFHSGLELPRLHDESPPSVPSARLATIEPQPLLGPLPVSNGPHKLVDFFLGARPHRSGDRAATPALSRLDVGDQAQKNSGDPFFLADPLSALSYHSQPASRAASPNLSPSEQLRSDEEAALTLSMMHGARSRDVLGQQVM